MDKEENADSTMEQLETEEVQEAEQADNKEPAIRPIKKVKDDVKKTAPGHCTNCLLYTSPSPRDGLLSRMPSSA